MIPQFSLLPTDSGASAEIAFWFCVAGLGYIYAGYPLLLWILVRTVRRPPIARHSGFEFSVVIVAHNESANLPRKLSSIFHSDCNPQIREVIVALDGATDDSEARVRAFPDPRVRVLVWSERRGKPAVLNDAVPNCQSNIVVLTDARQVLAPDALRELTSNFADPSIGVVSGELVLRDEGDATAAAQGIGLYWTYEKFIRRQESLFRSVPGATGALYAIRRELFQPIDPRTLLDDVVIPMQTVIAGYRCTFEPHALAFDVPSKSTRQEAQRKRRTIAGNAQLLVQHPTWLLPGQNPIWWEFVSHKILRLVSPLFLCGAGTANLILASRPLYLVLLTIQIGLYLSAVVGWTLQRAGRRSRCFGPALMFLTLNLTTVAALWDAARGRYQVKWSRTAQ